MFKQLTALAALALLAACATAPSVYGPSAGPGDPGFSQTQIEETRFRVTYTGTSGDSMQRGQDFGLGRAAELTLERGHDWFIVTDRYATKSRAGGTGLSIGAGFGGGGSGFGLGANRSFSGRAETEASLEIVLGSGPIPNNGNAHDARAVLINLRPASI